MIILKWILRKALALLGAALMVGLAFSVMDLLDGGSLTFPKFAEGVVTFAFFSAYIGALPALLTTGVSDAVTLQMGKSRVPVALGIHLLGGFLIMFILLGARPRMNSSDWLFVGLSIGAALVFFVLDEAIRKYQGLTPRTA